MQVRRHSTDYIAALTGVLDRFDHDGFERVRALLLAAYTADRRIFIMGNGGSAATAAHFTCDLNKGCCFDLPRKFKAVCLNDNLPSLLALANDVSYEAVFVEQLKNFFQPGDLVMGISASGNSENVLQAVDHARRHAGRTVGLCGMGGGRLARLAETALVVDSHDMQQVEDVHLVVVHMLMQALRAALHTADGGRPAPV